MNPTATEDQSVTLTVAAIDAGRNGSGGWNKKQIAILGLKWPPRRGWRQRLARSGKKLTARQYAEFLNLKGRTKAVERAERETVETESLDSQPDSRLARDK